MASTGARSGGRRRAIAITVGAIVTVVAIAVVAFAALNLVRGPVDPGQAAPAVYYAVDDRGDSRLVRVPLDGHTPASTVAVHRQPLVGSGWWSVSPDGDRIVWIQVGAIHGGQAGNSTQLDLLVPGSNDIAWSGSVDGAVEAPVLWSADGRWLAGQTVDEGQDRRQGRNFVADLTTRRVAVHVQVEPATPIGIAADGALILGASIDDAEGQRLDWQFSRMDPTSGEVRAVAAADAQTDPGMTLPLDVSARAGGFIAIEAIKSGPEADLVGQRIVLHELGGKALVELASSATSYGEAIFVPDGSAVLMSVRAPEQPDGRMPSSIAIVGLNGQASQLWSGDFAGGGFMFAAEGDLLGITGWSDRPRLVVVDLQTRVAVELPLAGNIRDATLVRVVGGARIADEAAVAPTPGPTIAAPTPQAEAIAGSARAFAFAYETATDGSRIAKVAVLAPAVGGAVAVVDRMPPIELRGPPDDLEIQMVVAPGGDQTLVLTASNSEILSASLWRPPAPPQSIELLAGWPSYPTPIWRPDGRALATVRDGVVLWFEIGKSELHEVKIPEFRPDFGAWYVQPTAWTDDGRSVVLGPDHCTDSCGLVYPTYEALDLATGVATPYRSGVSVDAHATGLLGHGASVRSGDAGYITDLGLTLFDRYEDQGALRVIAWPPAAGELRPEVSFPLWSADGSRLWLQARVGTKEHLFRLDDPVPPAPSPLDIGLMPDEWRLDDVDPAEHWAVARRVGDIWGFVDLGTGTVHEVAGEWSFAGFAAQP